MKNPFETLLQIGLLVLVAVFVGAGAATVVALPLFLLKWLYTLWGWAIVGAAAGLIGGLFAAFDSGHRFERIGLWLGMGLGAVAFCVLVLIPVLIAPGDELPVELWLIVLVGFLLPAAGSLAGYLSERSGRAVAEFLDLE